MKTSGLFNGEGFVAGLDGADQTVSHGNRYLLFILLVGLAVRLMNVLTASAIEMDGISYALIAEAIARGAFGEAVKAVFPPFYPLFVAITHFFVGDWELAGRVVSLVFGLLIIYVSYRFFKRLLGERKALYGAFILAIHPYLARYSGQVLSESLATLLFTVTVFSFYIGWQEERRIYTAASGLFLTLTYLTRPEYLAFYAPFLLFLAKKRRMGDTLLFLLPFLVLGIGFVFYLRMETGLWMVSRKVIPSPLVLLGTLHVAVSLVSYEFFIAIFPLFFFFALFGFKGVKSSYRNLVMVLVVVHIVSLSFAGHSTKRYSVEFVPISVWFVVEGFYVVVEYMKRFLPRHVVIYVLGIIIVASTVIQAYMPFRYDRALHKKAGNFLLACDPGSTVASRLPLAAFYGRGKYVNLLAEMERNRDLRGIVSEKKVKYVVLDEETMKALPSIATELSALRLVREFSDRDFFVRIYRVSDE